MKPINRVVVASTVMAALLGVEGAAFAGPRAGAVGRGSLGAKPQAGRTIVSNSPGSVRSQGIMLRDPQPKGAQWGSQPRPRADSATWGSEPANPRFVNRQRQETGSSPVAPQNIMIGRQAATPQNLMVKAQNIMIRADQGRETPQNVMVRASSSGVTPQESVIPGLGRATPQGLRPPGSNSPSPENLMISR
jgi:hypothetical protein